MRGLKSVLTCSEARKQQILIVGYYGWQNTGDDAMLYVLLQELHRLYPKAKFLVTSPVPVVVPPCVTDRTEFVKPTPIAASRAMLKSSVCILGGGTHIHDYGNRLATVKNLVRLLAFVSLARLLNNKVYFVAIGVSLTGKWGRVLAKAICRLATGISVRDRVSYDTMRTLGLRSTVAAGFDLGVMLKSVNTGQSGNDESNDRILGVCITSVFEQYFGDSRRDLLLADEIARQLKHRLNVESGLRVRLFVFKDGPRDSDLHITELLRRRLKPSERVNLIPYDPDPREMLAQVAQCCAFVGTKYHSCLFAYLSNIPLLIIDYHPKCRAFADEVGLPEHAVVSLHGVLEGQFGKELKNLTESPKRFCATLPVALARKRAREGIEKARMP